MDSITSIVGWGVEILPSPAAVGRRPRPQPFEPARQAPPADRAGDVDESNSATRAADDTARTSFFRMLLDHGIDPAQFRRDLLVSLARSEDGPADRSPWFPNAPAGLTVDATA